MSYPIIRKGQIYTQSPTGYGASVERYQKRFSKKKIAKLEKKLARFTKRRDKLAGRTSNFGARRRARRIARLDKKIQAIQNVLGMNPFEDSMTDQAMMEQMAIAEAPDYTNYLLIGGAVSVGAVILLIVMNRK